MTLLTTRIDKRRWTKRNMTACTVHVTVILTWILASINSKLLGRLSTDPLLREVLKAKTLNKINPMPGDTGRIFSRSEGSSPLPQILGKHLCCEPAMKIISTKRTSADSKYRCAYGGHSSTVILTPELKCILKERIRACKDKSDFSKLESKYTEGYCFRLNLRWCECCLPLGLHL